MTRVLADVRTAARSLARTPSFTLVSVLTLGLGVAANSAIFNVIDGVLLRPLSYEESDRLLSVNMKAPTVGYALVPFSEDTYLDFRSRLPSLEDLGMGQVETVNLIDEGEPEQVIGARITPSVLRILRVVPVAGRLLAEADAAADAEPVAVIAEEFWRRRWGADPGLIGSRVEFDGELYRIVGVLPAGLGYPVREARVWRPYVIDPAAPAIGSFSNPGLGRLRPGRTLQDVERELAAAIARMPEFRPDSYTPQLIEQLGLAPRVTPLKEAIIGDVRRPLLVVLATVALMLLVACANVVNLFLLRSESRHREVVLRAALGASRSDLLRLFLVEALLLAGAGGVLALALAAGAVRAFVSLAPVPLPRLHEVGVTGTLLVFNFGAAALAGLSFGAAPLLRLRGRHLAEDLREDARTSTTGPSTLGARNALVVLQVALALVLLVGSGLMLRSYRALSTVDPGFRAAGLLFVTLAPPQAEYPGADERANLWLRLQERFRALPGVASVGALDQVPLDTMRRNGSIAIEDHPTAEGELPPLAELKVATPGAFETLGVPLVAGRLLGPDDGADAVRAVVVSESFARHWWPEGGALGRRVGGGDEQEWWEIVGVVGDVHFEGLDQPAEEAVYFPLRSGPATSPSVPSRMVLLLRTEANPGRLGPLVRAAVRDVAPRLPVARLQPAARLLREATARSSFTALMLGIAAAISLFLGTVGIYGVLSYVVAQRTREIGIRVALGAPARTVRRMILGRGMALTGLGVGVGLVAALALSRLLGTLLYGVHPLDADTYAAVTVLLVAAALLACWLPARRAARVDPAEALRAE